MTLKSVCRSTLVKSNIRAVETEDSNFLGTIHSSDVLAVEANRWTKTLRLNQQEVVFKIDTGADITVIPDKYYSRAQDGPFQPVQCILTGAGQQPLEVQGQIVVVLQYNNLQTEQNIFVIKGLRKSLLGCPAIEALALFSVVELTYHDTRQCHQQIPSTLSRPWKAEGQLQHQIAQ